MTEKEIKLKIFGSEEYPVFEGTWADKVLDCCLELNTINALTDEMISQINHAVLKMRQANVDFVTNKDYLK